MGSAGLFLGGASNGDLAWNRFGETRAQLDLTYGGIRHLDIYAGGMYSAQQVRTWQRILGYLPGGRHRTRRPPPPPSRPRAAQRTSRARCGVADIAVTAGVRYDQFSAGTISAAEARGAQQTISPRFAVSTVLDKATVVVSYGEFTQAARLPVPG